MQEISSSRSIFRIKAAWLPGLSCLVAALVTISSLLGIFFPNLIYPSRQLRQSLAANDIVALLIGVPVLLVSLKAAREGKLAGQLFLPGALFFTIYNGAIYTLALPLSGFTGIFAGQVLISLAGILAWFRQVDSGSIYARLDGRIPNRFAAGILAGFGTLFFLWRGILLVQALSVGIQGINTDQATMIVDVLLSPLWIAAGVLLWRHNPLGYLFGTGLLFQLNLLFVSLLVYFCLLPLLFNLPFPVEDFIAVASMALFAIVPSLLYFRGVIRAGSA